MLSLWSTHLAKTTEELAEAEMPDTPVFCVENLNV